MSWNPPPGYPFEAPRAAAGPGHRRVAFEGLALDLEGLEDEADDFVARRFRRYLGRRRETGPDLVLRFVREPAAPFADPGPSGATYASAHAFRNGHLYYVSPTICARVDLTTLRGVVLTRPRTGLLAERDPVHVAVENLLRACLAWLALIKGGFMLHAASAIRHGRCYLFFGSSGAGKSTIAALCGTPVISDDLSLVLPGDDGLAVVGTPFRGTYAASEDLTGRYPLAALYRIIKIKDEAVRVTTRPRGVAFADFLANLPFVVGEVEHFPGGWDRVRAAFESVTIHYLHFRKDSSFWAAIDEHDRACRAGA